MSKRENLYRAMQEISDANLRETAEIKLKRRMPAQEEHTAGLWRHALSGVLAAAAVILVLGAATYRIWQQQNNGMGNGLAPAGQGPDSMAKIEGASAETEENKIIWVKEELTPDKYWSCDGCYLEFENGNKMIFIENSGPTEIQNWEEIADQVDFQNFDMIRIYVSEEEGIAESFPGRVCIAGILADAGGKAELTEVMERELENLEELGYKLKK